MCALCGQSGAPYYIEVKSKNGKVPNVQGGVRAGPFHNIYPSLFCNAGGRQGPPLQYKKQLYDKDSVLQEGQLVTYERLTSNKRLKVSPHALHSCPFSVPFPPWCIVVQRKKNTLVIESCGLVPDLCTAERSTRLRSH